MGESLAKYIHKRRDTICIDWKANGNYRQQLTKITGLNVWMAHMYQKGMILCVICARGYLMGSAILCYDMLYIIIFDIVQHVCTAPTIMLCLNCSMYRGSFYESLCSRGSVCGNVYSLSGTGFLLNKPSH